MEYCTQLQRPTNGPAPFYMESSWFLFVCLFFFFFFCILFLLNTKHYLNYAETLQNYAKLPTPLVAC